MTRGTMGDFFLIIGTIGLGVLIVSIFMAIYAHKLDKTGETITIPCLCGLFLTQSGDISEIRCGECGRLWIRQKDGSYKMEECK